VSNRGYVLVARGLLKHPRFKPKGAFSSADAMLWLIEAAAFVPRDVMIMVGTQRRVVQLERGQMTHSIRFLADAWCWSANRVQRFLRDLTNDGSVTTRTDTAQTIITLCNYEKYQDPFSSTNTQTDTQANTQTDTKKKELKEFNNDVVGTRAREPAKPLSEKVKVSPEKQAAIALGLAFLNAAGFADHVAAPDNWYGITDRAKLWIERGWSEEMIVAVTRHETGKRGVVHLNYYEKSFVTAAARAAQSLPAVATPLPGVARAPHFRQQGSHHRPISPDIAARRERAGLPPARPGSVSDAAALLIFEAQERERAEAGLVVEHDPTGLPLPMLRLPQLR
jgi:hypothetical protein